MSSFLESIRKSFTGTSSIPPAESTPAESTSSTVTERMDASTTPSIVPPTVHPVAEPVTAIPIVSAQAELPPIASNDEDIKEIEKMEVSSKQLDLVFAMDCTGSMGSYIEEGKKSIRTIVSRLVQEENCDVRFALIAYRDHPPQDSTFVTRKFDFTSNTGNMQKYLDCLSASGGGDGPEAVTAALYEAELLDWRANAAKVVVLIADAPPHGLGESGDGFPNGDPDGRDPLVIARSMASKGIIIYPVGCEPALSQYRNAKAFMVGLAEITQGYATSLSSSTLLPAVILGGAAEEIGLQNLAAKFEKDIAHIQETLASSGGGAPISDEEVAKELYKQMQSKNVRTKKWKCDGKISDSRGEFYSKNASLFAAQSEIERTEGKGTSSIFNLKAPGTPDTIVGSLSSAFRGSSARSRDLGIVDGFAPPPHEARASSSATMSIVETEEVSYEQVQKVMTKAKLQMKLK